MSLHYHSVLSESLRVSLHYHRCFKGEFTLSPGVLRVSLHYPRCFKGEFTLSQVF